jgi:uroporphyrinogen-III synthase
MGFYSIKNPIIKVDVHPRYYANIHTTAFVTSSRNSLIILPTLDYKIVFCISKTTVNFLKKRGLFRVYESSSGTIREIYPLVLRLLSGNNIPVAYLRGADVTSDFSILSRFFYSQSVPLVIEEKIVYKTRGINFLSSTTLFLIKNRSLLFLVFFSKRSASNFISSMKSHNIINCSRRICVICFSRKIFYSVSSIKWGAVIITDPGIYSFTNALRFLIF